MEQQTSNAEMQADLHLLLIAVMAVMQAVMVEMQKLTESNIPLELDI